MPKDDGMKRRIFTKLRDMEGRKLDVEIARWKGPRPHLQLPERLMENRFKARRRYLPVRTAAIFAWGTARIAALRARSENTDAEG